MASFEESRKIFFLVFAVGLAIRLVFVVAHQRPLFSDQADYHALASALSEEGHYGQDGQPTAYRPVGYPLFLAATYKVLGHDPLFPRLLQAFLDSFTALLLYLIGRQTSPRIGILAATFWFAFPPAILYANLLLAESLTAFLLVFTAFLLVGAEGDRGYWRFVTIGGILGAMALFKPWTGVFAIIVGSILLKEKISFSRVALAGATFLLLVAPWMVRNQITQGTFALSTNSGVNLYIGNNPDATGAYRSSFPDHLFNEGEGIRNRKALALAVDYIFNHPSRFLVNGAKKLGHLFRSEAEVLVWSFSSTPADPSIRFAEKYRSLPSGLILVVNLAYASVLLGGLLGLLSARKGILVRYTFWFLILTILIHGVFFGGSRFHFPLMPLFVLYAAVAYSGGTAVWQELSSRKKIFFIFLTFLATALWTYEFAVTF